MARLTRRSSVQRQEIPESYESHQQEPSLNSSDVESEDEGWDSQLILQQLTQEKPEDEDDDDGTVNLFDIVDFVNKAAVTPSKRDAQASRLSLPKSPSSPLPSSPRNLIETQESQTTQNTQSSTQSDEGHFANYMRRQKLAQQQNKQKSSPLRRPSTRAKTLSRSATPVDLLGEGKPDPYEFPASPEREIKPAPGRLPETTKDAKKSNAGGKRKRKETATGLVVREETREEDSQPLGGKRQRRGNAKNAATAQRAETLEEPVIARGQRRGQDKLEYSPENEEEQALAGPPKTALDILSSLPSTWAKSSKDAAITQVPATQSEFQHPQSLQLPESAYTVMVRKKKQEDPPKAWAGLSAEVQVSSPVPETPKRSRRAKSSSVAPQSASPRVLRKPRQHFKNTTSPVAPASASQLAEELGTEPSSTTAKAVERKKTASPEVNMKPTRTTRQSRREKARSAGRASFEPSMNVRALRSRKVEIPNASRQIEEEQEESLFVSQDEEMMEVDMEIQVEGDREMLDIRDGKGDIQVVINDDDSPWEEEAKAETEDQEDDEGVTEEGGVSGITSILIEPSPKKVPSQSIAVPHRPLRSQTQKAAVGQPRKVTSSQQPLPSLSPPIASMEDEDEDISLDSHKEESLVQDVADNSDTTTEYGRNPFDEPTFKFTSSTFSATSKCFIRDMLLDPDVREMIKAAKEVRIIVAEADRKTQQARDIHKLQQFLVADYKAMRAQHNSDEPDEGLICDLYGNVYTNTRKLHKKVYGIIDNDLNDDPGDISNGEATRRNKFRKMLLREIYLFIAPDLLRIIRSMIATYCSKGAPGMLCFEEIQGVVRITRNLLRIAGDKTNEPYRPKQLPDTDNDYHYPEYRKLIRTLENINKSCDTVLEEQVKYEKEMEMEEQHNAEAQKEKLRKQQLKELLQREYEERRRAKAEEAAEEERIRAEKLRAWQERNAPLLNQWKGKKVPRQFARSVPPVSTPNPNYQAPSAGSRGILAERIEEVGIRVEDPLVHDIRAIQSIISERPRPRQTQWDDRPVELRRKPVVAASGRKMPWAQNGQMPQVIVRPHSLPMSNNETDDEAFAPPQPPRQKRKFVHHFITSDEVDPTSNHDEARLMSDDEPLIPMDLDSAEEELPEHPVARRVPRARIEEEERSLTQRRLDEEQRLKLLKAEAENIEKERLAKLAAIAEVERRKAELEIQEREYYAARDQVYSNIDLDLDELEEEEEEEEEDEYEYEETKEEVDLGKVKIDHAANDKDDEDGETNYAKDDSEEQGEEEDIYRVPGERDDQSDEGSNNRKVKRSVKPWTHEDLSELITHLKFYEYKNKYIEAAESLGRSLADVIATANKHKKDWAEEYLRQGADVPPWVMDIGGI